MNPFAYINHIISRRRTLKKYYDVAREYAEIEETCIPSYLHANPVAAGVAWWRLRAAAKLHAVYAQAGTVLDFGCGSGEIRFLLPARTAYNFIDGNEKLVAALSAESPNAVRQHLDRLPPSTYAAIFALDSLEHNRNIEQIILKLKESLAPRGCMIVSGPTENFLYRIGRKIAGFQGDYHETDIYAIEAMLRNHFRLARKVTVPAGLPLFSISIWRI